ncbi:response regulator transcription factor [Halomonas alkalisoli]|uniref:response regulator transcription factor n=1 Tax=Halomonas alkalisoli TaxID=2907158 RepID=UPI001F1B3A19|nr:response regulator [Halomonas alkalisoli]MCE9684330.1 response regulator [Halomonas alkalisoli]
MPGKILICDDEPHIRRLIELSLEELESEGVELILTEDGEEALAEARAQDPDLVILDVMMPRLNGFDVCKAIRKDGRAKPPYVILLTSKGQEYDRQKGTSVGANRFMTKPFDPDVLVATAREILSGGR